MDYCYPLWHPRSPALVRTETPWCAPSIIDQLHRCTPAVLDRRKRTQPGQFFVAPIHTRKIDGSQRCNPGKHCGTRAPEKPLFPYFFAHVCTQSHAMEQKIRMVAAINELLSSSSDSEDGMLIDVSLRWSGRQAPRRQWSEHLLTFHCLTLGIVVCIALSCEMCGLFAVPKAFSGQEERLPQND